MRRYSVFLGALALLGSWSWGKPSRAASPDKEATKTLQPAFPTKRVPVRVFGGFLAVVPGQIVGLAEPQNFVLDTGTSPSILNLRVANEFRLKRVPVNLSAVGNAVYTEGAFSPELRVGEVSASNVPMYLMDLSSLEKDLGIPIAGILGLDVLGKHSFFLDYENRVLEFRHILPSGIPVALSPASGLPILETKVPGKVMRMLVDTGSSRVVLFADRASREVLANADVDATQGKSVATNTPVHAVSGMPFEVRGQTFRQTAYVVGGGKDSEFDGMLSVRPLGFRSVALDAESRTMYLMR